MASIAIIILNYNSTRLTKNCIQSLLEYKDSQDDYHIIVWDNCSTTLPTQSDFPTCMVVLSKKNEGFAGGNNRAVAHILTKATVDYIVCLNNDTRVTKGCVRSLVESIENDSDIGCVVPKIYFEKGHEYHSKSYDVSQLGKVVWYAGGGIDWANVIPFHKHVDEVDRGYLELSEETTFATGCCFLTTPQLWKKLKGFDERYFLYYEDTDFSQRMLRLGKKILFVPKSKLYHINAGSSQGSGSNVHIFYQTRNRLLFGLQYAGMHAKLALLKEAFTMWRSGSEMQRTAVLHAMEGRWGKLNTHNDISV